MVTTTVTTGTETDDRQLFGWAILSNWFADHDLTGPLVFMAAGLLLANSEWGIGSIDIEGETIHSRSSPSRSGSSAMPPGFRRPRRAATCT